MLETIDDLAFEPIGSVLTDQFSAGIKGRSPYNGTMPFAVELRVFCDVIDDEFVVTIRHGRDTVARLSHVHGFLKGAAMCLAVQHVLGQDMPDELADVTAELADYGYRYLAVETATPRGHSETVTILADSISELDAALALDSDPECIFDLLDGGADPMRPHIKFGRPFEVARQRARARPDYEEVVAYMRAVGAH